MAWAPACILQYSSQHLAAKALLLFLYGHTVAACKQHAWHAACAGAVPAPSPAIALSARSRTLTIVNACNFTVWPLTYGAPMLGTGSFMLRSGERTSFIAPPAWLGTWGARTGCQVDNGSVVNLGGSVGVCETGQCGPNFRCYNSNVAPYTQACAAPLVAASSPMRPP